MEFIFNGVIGTLVQQCGHDRPKPPIFPSQFDQFVLDSTVKATTQRVHVR